MKAFTHLRKQSQGSHQILNLSLRESLQIPVRYESSFVPKRVLLVSKISKYQMEQQANPDLNEEQLKQTMLNRGMNCDAVIGGHQCNKATETRALETLKHLNIECEIRNRYNLDNDSIEWADLVMPVGGDGTFLLASNLIINHKKPIIGINSDPKYSEGFLMLPKKYTNNIAKIFERLKEGNFKYLMRNRIRTTLQGDNIWQTPFHVHDKTTYGEKNSRCYVTQHNAIKPKGELPKSRQLPWLALNEVFIGECLSARISILHVKNGNGEFQNIKCSGMCVTTGTGSSSWYRTINSINTQVVESVLTMAGCKGKYSVGDMAKICLDYNSKLQFPPDQLQFSYAIREMIPKHKWLLPNHIHPRDFCDKLTVRSQCIDGGLAIDGGIAVQFDTGTTAVLESVQEDALCNIILPD